MSGAHPIYLPPVYNEKLGIWNPLTLETLEAHIREARVDGRPPRMLILTTCTYEGVLYPLDRIAAACEREGMLLYADEAWARYLSFHPFYTAKDGWFGAAFLVLEAIDADVIKTYVQIGMGVGIVAEIADAGTMTRAAQRLQRGRHARRRRMTGQPACRGLGIDLGRGRTREEPSCPVPLRVSCSSTGCGPRSARRAAPSPRPAPTTWSSFSGTVQIGTGSK